MIEDDQIQIQYHIWKKNAPHLYNVLFTQNLQWPSLTVQWLPDNQYLKDEIYSIHKIIYGTNTGGAETNFLMIARVKIPNGNQDKQNIQQNKQSTIGITQQLKQQKIQVIGQIVHDGQVNKVRANPFKPELIATKTQSGEVHIFNYTNRLKQNKNDKCNPNHRLVGHKQEGFALNWNNKKQGILLSGGLQSSILMFDIAKAPNIVQPLNKYQFHNSNVGDINFHKYHGEIFASGDDDGLIALWDIRKKSKNVIHSFNAHKGQVFTLDFSPKNQYLLCSGGTDSKVKIWDLRNLENSLFDLQNHKAEITKVQWSPSDTQIVYSASLDRKLNIWDLSKQQPLRYVHAGHRGGINEFDANLKQVDTICSVDENNDINVFKPNPVYMSQ